MQANKACHRLSGRENERSRRSPFTDCTRLTPPIPLDPVSPGKLNHSRFKIQTLSPELRQHPPSALAFWPPFGTPHFELSSSPADTCMRLLLASDPIPTPPQWGMKFEEQRGKR